MTLYYTCADCDFAITTSEDNVTAVYRLILSIAYDNNGTVSTNAITLNSQGIDVVDAVVSSRLHQMQITTSFCHISSLEVYRGRDQTIEISHQGFSLSEGGIIEVATMTLYDHHSVCGTIIHHLVRYF